MISTARRTRLVASALLPLALLAGCGDDSDDGDDAASEPGGETTDSTSCTTKVTAIYPDGNKVALDQTAGLDVGSGAAYTIYVADYEVTGTDTITGLDPDEEGHLATLAITTFNAEGTPEQVEEGATIDWTSDFGVLTFSVVLSAGTTAAGNTAGAAGTVEIVSLDDESICVDVDYSDDEKSLVGTIAADIG